MPEHTGVSAADPGDQDHGGNGGNDSPQSPATAQPGSGGNEYRGSVTHRFVLQGVELLLDLAKEHRRLEQSGASEAEIMANATQAARLIDSLPELLKSLIIVELSRDLERLRYLTGYR